MWRRFRDWSNTANKRGRTGCRISPAWPEPCPDGSSPSPLTRRGKRQTACPGVPSFCRVSRLRRPAPAGVPALAAGRRPLDRPPCTARRACPDVLPSWQKVLPGPHGVNHTARFWGLYFPSIHPDAKALFQRAAAAPTTIAPKVPRRRERPLHLVGAAKTETPSGSPYACGLPEGVCL